MELRDDLGEVVRIPGPVTRVISIVPSLTEAIAATRPHALLAATDWCTHPADLAVQRVRGTKNPDCRAIVELRPDLVVANMEENREIDVRRLRSAGIPVWVTRIETLEQAFASMRRLFALALRWGEPGWLGAAEGIWADPVPQLDVRVAVPVWRDPWIVVGSATFAGDIVERLGLSNVYAAHDQRYPTVGLEQLTATDVDLVLLPDEPYAFSSTDGPDVITTRTALISGRALTWYGPSLVTAREELLEPILAALT